MFDTGAKNWPYRGSWCVCLMWLVGLLVGKFEFGKRTKNWQKRYEHERIYRYICVFILSVVNQYVYHICEFCVRNLESDIWNSNGT